MDRDLSGNMRTFKFLQSFKIYYIERNDTTRVSFV